ncbi:sugar-binding domain-containing protein [Lactobacillus sp. UCMA15818]|uniref:sugar-binding transcriptional regulator n=1 Tax=Lactobacillus sp. UCMA15818 TaxID=2583394 RepID=UPI0025AFF567|nr:sugar-binding domain-containing protein [Lactobacillus sp. UCMA15818]MDN2453378.1 sugar-binding transcriptional regulator [Lactobacillus sp. UCMA15818]
MDNNRYHLLEKVAYLYYTNGYTQKEIAMFLGIERTTISRMLKKAGTLGIVKTEVQIDNLEQLQLELALQEKFNLKNVMIAAKEPQRKVSTELEVVQAAAAYLKQLIKPGSTIGFAWGTLLSKMVDQFRGAGNNLGTTFVPLVGSPSLSNKQYHANQIVYNAAKQFGGKSLFIDEKAIQARPITTVLNRNSFQKILAAWKQLDIAVVGVGGSLTDESSSWRDMLSEEDRIQLKKQHAIGDCCCTFFDQEGEIIGGQLLERTIAIPLSELRNIKNCVAVVISPEKALAILALLKMGFLTALITDEETARQVLRVAHSSMQ